jgi:hypothetical protein
MLNIFMWDVKIMRRNPQEVVLSLAYAVKAAPEGKAFSIRELNEMTGLHYETIKRYIELIEFIQKKMPGVEKDETSDGLRVMITRIPATKMSSEEQIVLDLFDKGSFRASSASQLSPEFAEEDIMEALDEALIVSLGDLYYLSAEGILRGAQLADARETERIESIGRQFGEYQEVQCEETTPNEWVVMGKPVDRIEAQQPIVCKDVDCLDLKAAYGPICKNVGAP